MSVALQLHLGKFHVNYKWLYGQVEAQNRQIAELHVLLQQAQAQVQQALPAPSLRRRRLVALGEGWRATRGILGKDLELQSVAAT